mmetsp:Transcript_43121/g.103316  ORF Transcript_43121/g.103316 Transcript_43121/m.103316 type:complete len:347 (+) Transcript_43121:187-1227(+)
MVLHKLSLARLRTQRRGRSWSNVIPLASGFLNPGWPLNSEQLVVFIVHVHQEVSQLLREELLQDLNPPPLLELEIRSPHLVQEGLPRSFPTLLIDVAQICMLQDAGGIPREVGLRHQAYEVVLLQPLAELAVPGLGREVRVQLGGMVASIVPLHDLAEREAGLLLPGPVEAADVVVVEVVEGCALVEESRQEPLQWLADPKDARGLRIVEDLRGVLGGPVERHDAVPRRLDLHFAARQLVEDRGPRGASVLLDDAHGHARLGVDEEPLLISGAVGEVDERKVLREGGHVLDALQVTCAAERSHSAPPRLPRLRLRVQPQRGEGEGAEEQGQGLQHDRGLDRASLRA